MHLLGSHFEFRFWRLRNRWIKPKKRYSQLGLHSDNTLKTEIQAFDTNSNAANSNRITALSSKPPHTNGNPVKDIFAVDVPLKEGCYAASDTDKLTIFSHYADELEAYTDGQEVIAFDVPIQAIDNEHVAPLDAKSGNRILLVDELDVLFFW